MAVVGLSTNPAKAAHYVPSAMQAAGFRVIPVHPSAVEILGERAYRRLADVPEPVEVVNVVRPSAEAPDIVRQAAEVCAKDRCIAIERATNNIVKDGVPGEPARSPVVG